MTRFAKLALLALLAAPLDALAVNTQVSPGSWKAAGKTGYVYGRSDGVFQEENSKAVYIVENGVPAKAAGFGVYESFTPGDFAAVPSALMTLAGLVQSASAQQLNIAYFGSNVFIFGQSTAQTILPVIDSVGLDISGDQVSAEAYEMFGGVLGASGRPAVIGVDPAFYFCATLEVADASGASDLHVGWRSATQTQTGTITTYLNYATIGLEGTSNPNTIQLMTGNDDTDVTTDTTDTWADAASKKLCVNVSAAGAVTYTINGSAPTATAAFSFDDGDSVIPFIQFQHGADVAGAVDLTLWEVGYQG
jgi:hypothetical protein